MAGREHGSYPRPQLVREGWQSLDGDWDFGYDDADVGLREQWYATDRRHAAPFDRTIVVPFPPESPASGIGDTAVHPVVWYRRRLPHHLVAAPPGHRTLVHFGAVDHRACVWVDGHAVGSHVGGQTPFTVDVTDVLTPGADDHVLVLRAEDDPVDPAQPRGKQTWRDRPHEVWYERTTGIWQTVWVEVVPDQRIEGIAWTTDPAVGVTAELTFAQPAADLDVRIVLTHDGDELARVSAAAAGRRARVDVPIALLRNGNERETLLWSPERPTLIDAHVDLSARDRVLDTVGSYVGIRTVDVGDGRLLVNDRPCYFRAVLHQGYRPRTHLANAGTEELRAEVELIKRLGFNAVRVHQKVEDPRFLYWADRCGLLVWGETGSAYGFDAEAVSQLSAEWTEIVRRDRSHPCVVAWVPVNESWGLPDLAGDRAQREFVQALASLTRALDPTRPVLSNEGWEHIDSDILGVHDYDCDPARLRARYRDPAALLAGRGPQGRTLSLTAAQTERFASGTAPIMVTEFGGLSLRADDDAFVYTQTGSDTEYAMLLGELFAALRDSPAVAGFCYTQFMDTAQETNGLVTDRLDPKLPVETIRSIVTGEKDQP